jgi:hypothetical protein
MGDVRLIIFTIFVILILAGFENQVFAESGENEVIDEYGIIYSSKNMERVNTLSALNTRQETVLLPSTQNLLTNGDFESGNFSGWTKFSTPNGISHPNVMLFDTNGDSLETYSAQFMVGKISLEVFDPTIFRGGGLLQTIHTENSSITISADIASFQQKLPCPPGSCWQGEGGQFKLFFDGVEVDYRKFGIMHSGVIKRSTLNAQINDVKEGEHEIKIEITRAYLAPGNLFQFVDNVTVRKSLKNDSPPERDNVIWYDNSYSYASNPALHLQNLGYDVEIKTRPIRDLGNADVVFIGELRDNVFSTSEITEIVNYVYHGGHLILAADRDYQNCNLDAFCAFDFTRDYFGFGFGGYLQVGTLTPPLSQSNHPIWTTPNPLSSFGRTIFDGYITEIFDQKNVVVLAQASGTPPFNPVKNVAGIIINNNPAFKGGKILAGGYTSILGSSDPRMIENVMDFMVKQDSKPVLKNTSGDNQWDTRPTFGISHEDKKNQVVEHGFAFNMDEYMITDNHHTDFTEQEVEIGTTNSFSATVYADKKLKIQEFLFGIPNVGEGHLAELGVEVWYSKDGNIEDVKVVQKSDVIDTDTVSVLHKKVNCASTDTEAKCDNTTISMTFLEPLKDKVMAIKAIDFKNRDQTTYLNQGFDISGPSLHSMPSKMIPSPIKGEGLIKVTQNEKYSDYWTTDDGRIFETNIFGSFKQINYEFERFYDSGNPYNRLHSEFSKIIEFEQKRAEKVFNSKNLISDTPESYAHLYPETHERITPELKEKMAQQEEIAKRVLEESTSQARW